MMKTPAIPTANLPVLLVIDVQQAFHDAKWGARNNPEAEQNVAKLIQVWRQQQGLIIFIQHRSNDPESVFYPAQSGYAFMPEAQPLKHEAVITKLENSAFIGTELEARLREMSARSVVVVGLTTDHCVSTTTRMGANLGFNMTVVSDATATFEREDHVGKRYTAQEIHDVQLASLYREFADILTTQQVLHAILQY